MSATPPPPERAMLAASGIFGFLGVALGAFGAHGLRSWLATQADAATRMGWWETAAHYQLVHALALAIVAWRITGHNGRVERGAGVAFVSGIVLFCGSLDAMTLGAPRWLGAVTPMGGVAFLIGWSLLVASAFRR